MAEVADSANGNVNGGYCSDLRTLLSTEDKDFLITNEGVQVPVSELQAKLVALYFWFSSTGSRYDFTPELVEFYKTVKEKGGNFEVVYISLDDNEDSFKQGFEEMPWLALPFQEVKESIRKLSDYFHLKTVPTLVVVSPEGKTLHPNATFLIREHGVKSYPFSAEKLAELDEIEKAREAAQTLESLLVCGETDWVIGKGGIKIPVAELIGKTILFYFSSKECPPCRRFTPKLIKAYHEIKAKDSFFEIIFVSFDNDQAGYEDYYSGMPWLALPFGDERRNSLSLIFKRPSMPFLVAVGPTGQTAIREARNLVAIHGSGAYPFTLDHQKMLEAEMDETAKGWPKKVMNSLHKEHELLLTRRSGVYKCDGCDEEGYPWSYCCKDCNYDVHPRCVLKEEKGKKEVDGNGNEEACNGEICYKV